MKSTKTTTPEVAPVRILKIAACLSNAGVSTLTYHIGCNAKSEIQVRIYANTGGGYFSNEWLPLTAIQQMLAKVPDKKPLTSYVLSPLFRGKSVNNAAFLCAVLKAEGLLQRSKEEPRCFERTDPKEFISKVKALINSSVNLKSTDKPQATASKSKPAVVPKKTSSKSSK